jgi:hypothetical protein
MSDFKITAPGIYYDFSGEAYFADPCPEPSFSQSIGKVLIEQSPLHARMEHPRLTPVVASDDDEPEKYDAAKAIGNAAHALMLGRGKEIATGNFKNWTSGDAKTFKTDALLHKRIPILAKHMARAFAMVEVARVQLKAMGLANAFNMDSGASEVVLAWQEPEGFWCRTMVDYLNAGNIYLYDYKTTGLSCAPHTISTMMLNAGWDVQAAMHERALDAIDPDNAGRRKFRFVAQENDAPYALTVCELPEATLTMGRKKLAHAMAIWAECLARNEWPGYPAEIFRPEYPGWAEQKWLGREIEHADRKPSPSALPHDLLAAG